MRKRRIILIWLAACILEGCALESASDQKIIAPDSIRSGVSKELSLTAPASEISEPEVLTLAHALVLTLEKNPELRSFSYTVRASEARVLQAGLRPNPELTMVVEDALGSGDYHGLRQSQSTLQLSQVIELGDKRRARRAVASAFRDQTEDEYEIKRIEILTSLTAKFIRTVADQHLLQLAKKAELLAEQALRHMRERSQAGGVSELEEAKARVLLARAHVGTEHAEHELLSSKYELAMFWGAETPRFSGISADLFQMSALPSLTELNSRIDQSLEIKKWASEKRVREAEQKLAVAKSIPNVTFGAGARRFEGNDDEAFVFQLSIPLNLFDRNQGGRKEALALTDKAVVDKEAAELRLKIALFGLYQEAVHEKTVIEAMRKEIIPQAERSLRIAQEGYNQGRFSYLDLLDAQRTLLEVSKENIEAAYSLHSYINSIERLLGAPLEK